MAFTLIHKSTSSKKKIEAFFNRFSILFPQICPTSTIKSIWAIKCVSFLEFAHCECFLQVMQFPGSRLR